MCLTSVASVRPKSPELKVQEGLYSSSINIKACVLSLSVYYRCIIDCNYCLNKQRVTLLHIDILKEILCSFK